MRKPFYFGRWDDPQAERDEYREVKDDLQAGRALSRDGYTSRSEDCSSRVRAWFNVGTIPTDPDSSRVVVHFRAVTGSDQAGVPVDRSV